MKAVKKVLTPKQKKIAAASGDRTKIDAADFKALKRKPKAK